MLVADIKCKNGEFNERIRCLEERNNDLFDCLESKDVELAKYQSDSAEKILELEKSLAKFEVAHDSDVISIQNTILDYFSTSKTTDGST